MATAHFRFRRIEDVATATLLSHRVCSLAQSSKLFPQTTKFFKVGAQWPEPSVGKSIQPSPGSKGWELTGTNPGGLEFGPG